MDIILTHEQADFDAAGSVLAAWLLDPSRMPLLPKRRNRNLAAFLDDYKNRLPFHTWQTLPKGPINRVYITDTQSVAGHSRLAGVSDLIVWDHHPKRGIIPDRPENIYDPTGACTTFLVEKLMERHDLHPGRIFATLMLMGIYEDTGSLSYGSTTPRDIRAAAWLVEKGGDLDLMRRYILQPMTDHQQQGSDLLLQNLTTVEIKGKQIILAHADIREISDEFSAVAHHLRDMLNPDGLILMLAVRNGIRIICRSTTDDIDFGAMMRSMNGGGHARAASSLIPIEDMEGCNAEELLSEIKENVLVKLPDYIRPGQLNLSDKLNELIPSAELELIRKVADTARQLGMPVYIVGGVVRDLLLQQPVMDFDIVVEGDAILLGQRAVEKYGGKLTIHPQFFTAKWKLPNGDSLDLISARSESYAAPAALPTVSMGDMEADLRRRDFTLNTLAVRLDGEHYGELLDICGGLRDLDHELIRTLHNRSFIDDPTRMFRAVRFEQRLSFLIEPDTMRQMNEQMDGIRNLTGQRIWHELRLYCDEASPEKDFARISQLGIAAQIHGSLIWNPELETDCIRFRETLPDSFWRTQTGIDYDMADAEGPLWIWLSSLSLQTIAELSKRLLISRQTQRCIEGLAHLRTDFPGMTVGKPSEITFFLEKLPPEALYCYSLFCPEVQNKFLKEFMTRWHWIVPANSGNDLIKMGITPGPNMHKLLTGLRAACIDDDLQPEEEAEWIRQFMESRL